MSCIDKYLYNTAKEIIKHYLIGETEITDDYIMTLAYNAGDNLSAEILSNIYSILEKENIKIIY